GLVSLRAVRALAHHPPAASRASRDAAAPFPARRERARGALRAAAVPAPEGLRPQRRLPAALSRSPARAHAGGVRVSRSELAARGGVRSPARAQLRRERARQRARRRRCPDGHRRLGLPAPRPNALYRRGPAPLARADAAYAVAQRVRVLPARG